MTFLSKLTAITSICLTFLSTAQIAPGANCGTASCATAGSYASLSGPSMGSYDCLGSTPNPSWVAIGIGTSGTINIQLTQTSTAGNPIDVDFALYGPYTSAAAACPIGPGTPTVDCSFSASATEFINIVNAVAGQVYMILITNYNGSAGTITLTPLASTGTTNCAINFSATTTSTPATCNQATGSVNVTPNGGYAPYTYSWSIPGNPTTPAVSNVAPGTYTVTITSSPNPANGQTVNPTTATVTVANQNATFSSTSTPASCAGGNNGTATANFNAGGAPGVTATYAWNDPAGQTTQTATGLTPGAYLCTVTLSNGCSGTTGVNVGANTVTYTSSTTQVSCAGGADGTATVNMTPVVGVLSYSWSDAANQTTQTATGLSAGTYSCVITSTVGCTNTQTVTITEIPALTSSFINQSNVTCHTGNDGVLTVNASNGTGPYSYSWDKSISTSNTANDLMVGDHTVTITDNRGCQTSSTATLTEPNALDITFTTPDTQICPEDDITLTVIGTGGSTAYTYTWYEGANLIGTGASILVDPVSSPTVYTVVLSEQCGSPTDQQTVTLTFPAPIYPSVVPNQLEDCVVGEFEFVNTSSNSAEIATTYFDFGDLKSTIEIGTDSTSHDYDYVGTYSVFVSVTSIYGCVYDTTYVNLLKVVPNPVARFFFSDNPASVYETTIKSYDKSSGNVVTWEWTSLGSNPTQSTQQNPTWVFPDGIVGEYPLKLVVTSIHGCQDSTTQLLSIEDDLLFYAPNTFTPDGNEHNQTWKLYIKGGDVNNFELMIFNRWGEMVWESHDMNIGWDGSYNGKISPTGTYTWIATVKNKNDDGKKSFNGHINLVK